jgi:putative membrane protein
MPDPLSESTVLARERTALAHHRTEVADQRTLLALDRTLQAWIRTALSLISFGFTIYKFFDYLQRAQPAPPPPRAFGPREFAIAMIAGGLIALALAAFDYHFSRKRLLESAGSHAAVSLALLTAMFVASLGIGGLLLAIFRQ